jgi:hypothetical protein
VLTSGRPGITADPTYHATILAAMAATFVMILRRHVQP